MSATATSTSTSAISDELLGRLADEAMKDQVTTKTEEVVKKVGNNKITLVKRTQVDTDKSTIEVRIPTATSIFVALIEEGELKPSANSKTFKSTVEMNNENQFQLLAHGTPKVDFCGPTLANPKAPKLAIFSTTFPIPIKDGSLTGKIVIILKEGDASLEHEKTNLLISILAERVQLTNLRG
eukprot:TRINITY_DN3381_c0_g1_i1.p1 TRINITY_DN3381_c0_g1~~TRINITY_DN3381_c0_g1_i1.p1  ORF type:complete len:182 (+),score=49.78 TRINITY_DN3381_c0_g1_i1:339-884(+)